MFRSLRAALAATPVPATGVSGLLLGTPVLTLDGELPVEHLFAGDRIITRDGVARPARDPGAAVASCRCRSDREPQPGRRPAALRDVLVSPGARLHRLGRTDGRGAAELIWRRPASSIETAAAEVIAVLAGSSTGRRSSMPAGSKLLSRPKAPATRKTPGSSSGRSSAISPGPKLTARTRHAARPPSRPPASAPGPRASSPVMNPASTSPAPAVASQGAAAVVDRGVDAQPARPGPAITVSGPFSSTMQPARAAASPRGVDPGIGGPCSRRCAAAARRCRGTAARTRPHAGSARTLVQQRHEPRHAREQGQRIGIEHGRRGGFRPASAAATSSPPRARRCPDPGRGRAR